jgi:Double zinc ribbon/Adenylate and Guanylate cyclase catalytic domain
MKCANCGAENPPEQKFCNECATPFKRRCSKCGYENAPTAKFCGDCATALTSSTASKPTTRTASTPSVLVAPESSSSETLEGERKTVTALFADIKGSMELMEDLDPEEARAIVDPTLKLMMDAVHRYGGYVAQSTGDGIFALFGAPVAHEDHPQRALYARSGVIERRRGRGSCKCCAAQRSGNCEKDYSEASVPMTRSPGKGLCQSAEAGPRIIKPRFFDRRKLRTMESHLWHTSPRVAPEVYRLEALRIGPRHKGHDPASPIWCQMVEWHIRKSREVFRKDGRFPFPEYGL